MTKISFNALRKLGIVQEINRQLLHPRGMSLTLSFDDLGNEVEMYVDKLPYEAGYTFNSDYISLEKAQAFQQLLNDKVAARMKEHKFLIQPLPVAKMRSTYEVAINDDVNVKTITDQLDASIIHQAAGDKILISTTDEYIAGVLAIPGVKSVVLK